MIHINTYDDGFIDFINENDKYHRIGGPAVIFEDYQEWYQNGIRHREDGPAVIDGNVLYWYIEGKEYIESEYHKKLKEMGLK